MIVWPRPLASSSGEGVEERFSSGFVEGGVVVAAGGHGVFAVVDPRLAFVGVGVEDGFEVRPDSRVSQDLQADCLGRAVGPCLADCDEA